MPLNQQMKGGSAVLDDTNQIDLARQVYEIARKTWGVDQAVPLIGRHPSLAEAVDRVARVADADAPVLIVGETGTGKELFARMTFLLGRPNRRRFIPVNCSQYVNDQVMVSELFGHIRGSFTGAVRDHAGIFQDADGGTVFLDEVGELSPAAQAMLLRVLGDDEILPLGATRPKRVNVRVIAATNRDLPAMVGEGTFREDLYFRLQRLKVRIPPLRERGRDWKLIADYFLNHLSRKAEMKKRLALETLAYLSSYPWPGNVRELQGCVETGFYMSRGSEIKVGDLAEALEATAQQHQWSRIPFVAADDLYERLEDGKGDFWKLIYKPFMARDLNRRQVRAVIADGLARTNGSYKRLLPAFGIAESDYLRFMDFLRHHALKPARQPAASRAPTPYADHGFGD